jgi:hypothetical protein
VSPFERQAIRFSDDHGDIGQGKGCQRDAIVPSGGVDDEDVRDLEQAAQQRLDVPRRVGSRTQEARPTDEEAYPRPNSDKVLWNRVHAASAQVDGAVGMTAGRDA